jgi:hypothetical protein
MNLKSLLVWAATAVLILLLLMIGVRTHGAFRLQAATERFQKEAGPLEPGMYAPPLPVETENAAILLQGGAYATVLTWEERGFLRLRSPQRNGTQNP